MKKELFSKKEPQLENLENSHPVQSIKNEKVWFKKNIKVWLDYHLKKSLWDYMNRNTACLSWIETGQNERSSKDLDVTGEDDGAIHLQTCGILQEENWF